jgi:hypothetical protein
MKCETKTDEMIEILSELQEYVPTHSKTTTIPDPHFEYTTDEFHHLLFGEISSQLNAFVLLSDAVPIPTVRRTN